MSKSVEDTAARKALSVQEGSLPYDLRAGSVVFLVALPLCLGIALASGAPLLARLITGIVGGIVVSQISKSPLAVTGPAADLTVLVLASGSMKSGRRLAIWVETQCRIVASCSPELKLQPRLPYQGRKSGQRLLRLGMKLGEVWSFSV